MKTTIRQQIISVVPVPIMNWWCHKNPKLVIDLLKGWVTDLNPNPEERWLQASGPAWVPVAKKLSLLSSSSILSLLKQDANLWGAFPPLRFILLEIMYDLGGNEGRKKVQEIVNRIRVVAGGPAAEQLFESLKTDIVIELFENMPEFEVRMRLAFNHPQTVALWLDHWDLKMKRLDQPMKSAYWIGKIPGRRGFEIQALMKDLEFRRKYEPTETIYDYTRFGHKDQWKEAQNSLQE